MNRGPGSTAGTGSSPGAGPAEAPGAQPATDERASDGLVTDGLVTDGLAAPGRATAGEPLPGEPLRPYVAWYTGYRQRGVPPACHRGLPSPFLTLIFTLDEPLVMLAHPDPRQPPGAFGAYVVTAEPDALYERAKAAGAEITAAPHDTDYGSRDFAARDPEGNRWSFGTYRGEPRKT